MTAEQTSERTSEYDHGYQNGLNQGNLQYHILKQDLLKNMIPRAKVRTMLVKAVMSYSTADPWHDPTQADAEAIADRLLAEECPAETP